MINPFHYMPCLTLAEYTALPTSITLNEHTFVKRAFVAEKQHAEYVWEELFKDAYSPLL